MKDQTRREFLGTIASGAAAMGAGEATGGQLRKLPNVIFILSDDQGYGDYGFAGNTQIQTPAFDKFYSEGAHFTNFYVQPVCSPTRSCLMTGRYFYRTGIVDTWVGVSIMRATETTLAQALSKSAGYKTGIFGKWHLGDHYPYRPMDRGFDRAVTLTGGGINGTDDPLDNYYSDPTLSHNGVLHHDQGYCTDIFFDEAIRFIEENREHPFFIYLPTNVVHEPLQVPEKYAAPYRALGLDDSVSKLYGMVANLDLNIATLFAKLEELGLEENTAVLFLSDNGGAPPKRFNGGLRGYKGEVYEGGTKTQFLARWKGRIPAGKEIDRIGGHIDIFPTIFGICGVPVPNGLELDGANLFPLMTGEAKSWPDRHLFIQQSRPDADGWNIPRPYTHAMVRGQRNKIVMSSPGKDTFIRPASFSETELYDMENDPGEQHNIAAEHPEIVFDMRMRYENWFWDVTRGLNPPVRNHLGTTAENPIVLATQDMRGPHAPLAPWNWVQVHYMASTEMNGSGYYEVEVTRAGRYRVSLRFGPPGGKDLPIMKPGKAYLSIAGTSAEKGIAEGDSEIGFEMPLKAGPTRLEALLTGQRSDGAAVSPVQIEVKYLGS
jgi:arylsulfatase A-like enzyme